MNDNAIAQRDALAAELESLNIQEQITGMERELRLRELESEQINEAWGDFITHYEPRNPDNEFHNEFGMRRSSRPDDRKHGDNAPLWTNEKQLADIRGAGEWIAQSDTTAKGMLRTMTNYTINKGFVWVAASDRDDKAADIVQRIIDDFCVRSRWCSGLDKELFQRTRRSGERFVRLLSRTDGLSEVEVYEPSWIMEPQEARSVEEYYGLPRLDWKYGVATYPGYPDRVIGYYSFRDGDPAQGEWIPVDQMSHVKVNVDRRVKRGLPDFYPNEEWLLGAAKLMRRTVQGGAIQAAIALIREYPATTNSSKIRSAADSQVRFTSYTNVGDGTNSAQTTGIPTEHYHSGKIMDVKGAKYHPGPMGGSNAPTYMEIVAAADRRAGRIYAMPEFMITGDASNNNLASTLSAGSDFVNTVESIQEDTVTDDTALLWLVVKNAAEGGITEGYSFGELTALVDIVGTPPDVKFRDEDKRHQQRKDEHEAGILSRETWADEVGRDYAGERKRIESEPPVEKRSLFGSSPGSLPSMGTDAVDAAVESIYDERDIGIAAGAKCVQTTQEALDLLEAM